MATYIISFSVNGGTAFPLDMLRYDACYPKGSDDASRINDTIDRSMARPDGQREPIWLVHRGNERTWQPTTGRWSSFLWGVDPQSIDVRKCDGSLR